MSYQAALKARLFENALEVVKRGRDAKSVMALPMMQEFFAEQLALAFEQFLGMDMTNMQMGMSALASLHFRARAVAELADHLEQAKQAGDAALATMNTTEKE